MTSRAGRRLGEAFRAVGTMAIGAAARDLTVLGAGLGGMAAGTRRRCFGGTGVGFVAIHAWGMAGGRAVRFFGVAALAGGSLRAAVRLVTIAALAVSGAYAVRFCLVASAAHGFRRRRLVRQPGVTARAALVARA
jgi:hypothetical protein